ncbi:M3 family oligoendopeptidase [Enterococcus timonensis]|uniref:M3 family oligoendopeptidase n=1 Tax=Enterococcus timonensis TaxID=1852364 RepID=UPI0008DA4E21|nr:M3 family oligoendopeptidase [Enterococcus timonensis]
MQFKDFPYTRPDYKTYEKNFKQALETLTKAQSPEEAVHAITTINVLRSQVDTMANIALIRYSVNTEDKFYEGEDTYWNEYSPLFDALDATYYSELLASSFQEELRAVFPATIFLIAEGKKRLFDEAIIPLQQKENQLVSAYSKLVASAQISFQEGIYTLSQLIPFLQSSDRSVRKAAEAARFGYFAEHEDKFDDIYDQMVHVRTEIAHKLGFKDYVDYSYVAMNRWGYDRTMVETYRKNILQDVVPVVDKLDARQKERLGLDNLYSYDLDFTFPSGNPKPQGTPEELVENARQMYHQLSKETGEFFDFMVENGLLDLLSKRGKQSGGYCTYIMNEEAPFIFANFNGTSGDVDVLTHEAGHAFQCYQSRWIKEPEIIFPNNEAAEIHSMSMEFITYPYMDKFFGDETNKHKFNHLSSAVKFLPYGVLVDHFQQVVYENPDWSPKERKDAWRKLEKMYQPGKDYSENPDLERGLFWMKQGHIFESPFYYIDYTLAQVCAFQFWQRFNVSKDENAWKDYMAICQVGGSQTFMEILETGHLTSPFEDGAMTGIIENISNYLSSISEDQLK